MSTVTRMTSPRWGMTLVAAAAVALTTFWSTMGIARAGERSWTVKQVTGAARMHHNGDGWRMLRAGDVIAPGTRVETTDNSRLLLVRPGDSIDVSPNSRFDVPLKYEPNPQGVKSHIIQSMGTLLFKITTRPENPFGVRTPYLAAVIKGTTFTVSVDGPRSALHVSHGAVEVTSVLTGQIVMVRPGMTAAIDGARGGAMQVLGQRGGKAAGAAATGAGKTVAKSATGLASDSSKGFGSGKGRNVIDRTVGGGRVNVFESSRGLVHDLKNARGIGNGSGVNAGQGNHTAAMDNGKSKNNVLNGAPVNANGIGNGGGIGGGNGGGIGSGNALGNNSGPGGGNGGGLGGGNGGSLGNNSGPGGGNGGGIGNGVGNNSGPGGGNGNGNAGGNGNGKGKKG